MKNTTFLLLAFGLFYLVGVSFTHAQNCENLTLKVGNGDFIVGTIAPPPPVGPPPPSDIILGKRIVYYLHGLGGAESAWQDAGTAMNVYRPNAIPRFMDFSNFQQGTISAAALVMRYNSNSKGLLAANEGNNGVFNIDPENNYIVASSLGCVVAREIDRQYHDNSEPYRFGGMALFGGANLGASIVDGIDDLKATAVTACVDLVSGPIKEEVPELALSILNVGDKIDDILPKFCSTVSGVLISQFLGQFLQPIIDDYGENAPFMAEINGYSSPLYKVAFYGVETEPVFWRTMQFSGVFGVSANTGVPFSANNDDPVWEDVQNNMNKYYQKSDFHWAQYHALQGGGWLKRKKAAGHKEKAIAWGIGGKWWETSNDKFKTAMGHRELTVETQIEHVCICTPFNGGMPIINSGYCNGAPSGYTCFDTYSAVSVPVWTDIPSDGIVKASSAAYLPDATHPPVEMPGSSHFSMRNDANTEECLKGLYSGAYGDYFIIEN
jgi:hypothetical protein